MMSVCNMGFVLLFIVSMAVLRGTESLITYQDLSKLVRENINMEEKAIVASKSCNAQQCKEFEKMCQNGGKCIVTETCGCRCKCPPGYTGFFCRLKATTTTSGPVTQQTETVERTTMATGKETMTTANTGSSATASASSKAEINKSASDSVIKSATLDSVVNKLSELLLKPKKEDTGKAVEGGFGGSTPKPTESTSTTAG